MNPDASSYGGGNSSRVVSVGDDMKGLSGTLSLRFAGAGGGSDGEVDERLVARAIALSDARPSGFWLGLFDESSMSTPRPGSLHSLFGSSQGTSAPKWPKLAMPSLPNFLNLLAISKV
jgi:hypothetical protein